MTLPTSWTVTLRVTLGAKGNASLKDWLLEYSDHCPRRVEERLRCYMLSQLVSNSDWDGVDAQFEIEAIQPDKGAAR